MHVHRVPSASVTASGAVTVLQFDPFSTVTLVPPILLFQTPVEAAPRTTRARRLLYRHFGCTIHGHRRGRMHHMQRRIASAWLERDPLWPHLPLRVFEALARAEANVPALQIRLQGWLDKGAPGASANCSRRGSQDARPR